MANSEFWQRPRSFLSFLQKLLTAQWRVLLLLLLGVGLPLLGFEQLAVRVWRNQGGFPWDEPILRAVHATAQPRLDRVAAALTKFGVFRGVFPVATVISLALLYRRRWRSLTYLLLTLSGSVVINRTAKAFLHRLRPHLWDSIAPELDFAFPSGHAMSSMTLVAALVILTWGTRWCGVILAIGCPFVLAIGWTRLYLGVHFPSDVLAGWMVSLAWAIGVALVIRPHLTLQSQPDAAEETLLAEEVEAIKEQQ
ncbi:MAG TPA: phosphatase PAP2 family protein [Thermosynechococcaceae cyanobacterium]